MSQSRFDDAQSEPVLMALPRVDLELIAREAQSTVDHFRSLIVGPDFHGYGVAPPAAPIEIPRSCAASPGSASLPAG